MVRAKLSRQPSQYPPLPFHLIRLGLCVSAIIDTSILCFFIYHLKVEHFPTPWTFILLLTVSVLTLLALLVTTSIHYLSSPLPARSHLITNSALSILWILALSFLTWNLSWTLGHHCYRSIWHNTAGIMVCRLYKALTAFVVTATACTFAAVALDARVHSAGVKRGKYGVMLEDTKHPMEADPWDASTGSHQKEVEGEFGNGFEGLRGGVRVGGGAKVDVNRPYQTQKPIEAGQFGYVAPSEQTRYDGAGGTHFFG